MSSLYFGLDVFYQFKAGVPEFDEVFSVQCTVLSTVVGGRGCVPNSGTLASNRQNIEQAPYDFTTSLCR
jgi:hypothetical protein